MARLKGSRNRRTVALKAAVETLAADGVGGDEIANRLQLNPRTVKDLIVEAKARLEADSPTMLGHWATAAREGALKGRHEPSRDWLLHAGVIQPVADSKPQGPQIIIGIASLPGLPSRGESPLNAITVSPLPTVSD
jgi:DNA-binding CsgD family transcriptional regulator